MTSPRVLGRGLGIAALITQAPDTQLHGETEMSRPSMTEHEFEGREDRGCVICGKPDRDPIHIHKVSEIKSLKIDVPLRKVSDIQLLGKVYAIGKNGHYYLVDESSLDAWGKNIGQIIEPHMVGGPDVPIAAVCSALLDALGEAVEKIKSLEMGRERRMGAATEKPDA